MERGVKAQALIIASSRICSAGALPAEQADLGSQKASVDTRLASPRRVAPLVSGELRVARSLLEVHGRMPVQMDRLSLAQGHKDPAMQPSAPE